MASIFCDVVAAVLAGLALILACCGRYEAGAVALAVPVWLIAAMVLGKSRTGPADSGREDPWK